MNVTIDNKYELVSELHAQADPSGVPLHTATVTGDLAELIDEALTRGFLSEAIPGETQDLHVEVLPHWKQREPIVDQLELRLRASANGAGTTSTYSLCFGAGRWVRSAQRDTASLREEGTLAEDQLAYRILFALERRELPPLAVPPLQPPPVLDGNLADLGIRHLGPGHLVPDRPVLINRRLVADAVRRCEESGTIETGGAVLGAMLRLPEPLPDTATRIVTVLSATVDDPRHEGAPLEFKFSPAGLAEAARIGDLRGLGETVQTVFHTHGWSARCQNPNCNENANCPLAECNPSLQDYTLLETLFTSKATLMPIAGRKFGEKSPHPVLQVHAWRGGEMRPIRWQEYGD